LNPDARRFENFFERKALFLTLCLESLTNGLRHDKQSYPVDKRSNPVGKQNITSTPSVREWTGDAMCK
jgi:hypothetical protein